MAKIFIFKSPRDNSSERGELGCTRRVVGFNSCELDADDEWEILEDRKRSLYILQKQTHDRSLRKG